LKQASESSEILITAGVLSQAVTHYGEQTQRQVAGMRPGAASLAKTFLSHLEQLHSDSESRAILAELRSEIEAAIREGRVAQIEDENAKRLESLAAKAEQKRRQLLELSGRLADRVAILEHAAAPSNGMNVTDPGTGLPARIEADQAIRQAVNQQPRCFAVVFYVHRMQLTNARFGEAIGNQLIAFCSQHIGSLFLHQGDRLFRWSGPAFVAILERGETLDTFSAEVHRLIGAPMSRFFETPNRSVYLPIKVTAEAIPLFETSYAEVMSGIENFILTASGQMHGEH
jgi:GGDEF domain-containing protein